MKLAIYLSQKRFTDRISPDEVIEDPTEMILLSTMPAEWTVKDDDLLKEKEASTDQTIIGCLRSLKISNRLGVL